MLHAISPIDGRYYQQTQELSSYFSEFGLIKYRVLIELKYLAALKKIGLPELEQLDLDVINGLIINHQKFNETAAIEIKAIEKITNHDVKAVEYYIKKLFDDYDLAMFKEFVHFGLTSQDINNTAFPLMIKEALNQVLIPKLNELINLIGAQADSYRGIPMLAHTHGQPASPTTVGKEFQVFVERLMDELEILTSIRFKCKFGGATGNFNAHKVTYPNVDWINFGKDFAAELGLHRSLYTTQIAHYDDLGAIFHSLSRINTILIDFSRDLWTYISMEYFKQKVVAGEIGSSAMPHKVNPIDFENAEGNLGMANAIYGFLAEKLPISRLQRDLTDSTVMRNIGVPFGHTLIAYKSLIKGINKLTLNQDKLNQDLDRNWAVVAEAIQNILRREQYPEPYEALKNLTRGKSSINMGDIHQFINTLDVNSGIKAELLAITPHNYTGYY